MPNALSPASGPPPAPMQNPAAMPQGNALAPPPGGAPGLPGAMPGQPPAQQQQPPAPSHQQTVAALRHIGAIEKELSGLLADPDLGKTDMHSKIIDGTTKLVASGMVSPSQAVQQLGTVPEQPFEQKQWLEQHFAQTIQAQSAVLQHHRAAFQGMPGPSNPGSPDDHLADMASLTSQFKGGAGA